MKLITFQVGRCCIVLFPYWIGFSNRDLKTRRVIDFGLVKFMWTVRK